MNLIKKNISDLYPERIQIATKNIPYAIFYKTWLKVSTTIANTVVSNIWSSIWDRIDETHNTN